MDAGEKVALTLMVVMGMAVTAIVTHNMTRIGYIDKHECLSIAQSLYEKNHEAGATFSSQYCWPKDGHIKYPDQDTR